MPHVCACACVQGAHICRAWAQGAQGGRAKRFLEMFCAYRQGKGINRRTVGIARNGALRHAIGRIGRVGKACAEPLANHRKLCAERVEPRKLRRSLSFCAFHKTKKNAPIGEQWADWTRGAHPISSRFVLFFTSVFVSFSLAVLRFSLLQLEQSGDHCVDCSLQFCLAVVALRDTFDRFKSVAVHHFRHGLRHFGRHICA